jgi:RNA polymerase sigma-70 factor (ECF subfamily)
MDDMATTRLHPEGVDEAELVASLRTGDPAAYEKLVRLYGPRLLSAARRILRNEEDAREAVQDAFLSSFRGIHGFDGGVSRLSTWLHRITINAALMKLRRLHRQQELPIDTLLPTFHDNGHPARLAVPWQESGDRIAERQENRLLVRACIDQLPETYRTVLLLRDIEEFDTEETANLLGVSPGVVKTRLHRARQALRALLDPHFRGGAA